MNWCLDIEKPIQYSKRANINVLYKEKKKKIGENEVPYMYTLIKIGQ